MRCVLLLHKERSSRCTEFADFPFLMEAHHFLCEARRDYVYVVEVIFRLQSVNYPQLN
jgi:hypothetical protein